HTSVDGDVIVIDATRSAITDNGDGTYTIVNQDGDNVVINTNANTSVYDNTNSGLSSGNVQDAIDELVTTINTGSGVRLNDNGDGTVSLVAEDGTVLGTVNKSSLTDNTDGTYTFDNGNGSPVTINVISDVADNIVNQGDIY
ncbi:hypothetical protein, partial [Sinomicrobium oceani]|uniref:hypothetical protein n=1 Tax=Sinomicrobium oceani TaxID=1150368 RepID=UPI00227C4DB4